MWDLSPSSRSVTCVHTSHSWFSTPDGDADVESARATLRELLAESVIFGRISAFYPPHPAPSETKQSLARHELLAAFDASIQRKGGSSRREPGRTPERKFTRFPELPTEIRLQIWRAALPRHRTLHLGQKVDEPYSWTARLPIPTLSRVCRESREVVMRTVFPIYGRAPYRSGPGSSQDVARRFVTSWASYGDCLDLGANARPAALRCGDYLERAGDFHAVAQSLLGLFPWAADDESGGHDKSEKFPKGVPRLMVVLQVVYISFRPPISTEDEDYIKAAWEDAVPALGGPPRIFEVDDLINTSPFNINSYDSSVHRRPKEHHISTVASLRDRKRIKELLALGSVTGHWNDPKMPRDTWPRLRAMHYQSSAFCMDCLLEWWEKHVFGIVQRAMSSTKMTPLPGDGLDEASSPDSLPELVPAVRFKIQWPGLEEYDDDSRSTCHA